MNHKISFMLLVIYIFEVCLLMMRNLTCVTLFVLDCEWSGGKQPCFFISLFSSNRWSTWSSSESELSCLSCGFICTLKHSNLTNREGARFETNKQTKLIFIQFLLGTDGTQPLIHIFFNLFSVCCFQVQFFFLNLTSLGPMYSYLCRTAYQTVLLKWKQSILSPPRKKPYVPSFS